MSAGSLNCPMCGASARSDATRCEHCGSRLATVACPACFGMIFEGARFCSHCGARADRAQLDETAHPCPRCKIPMHAVSVGEASLLECPRCAGVWADVVSLDQICSDRDKQAAVLGAAMKIPDDPSGVIERNIRYIPCPVCKKLMNRVNFAKCSQVVVDVCKGHGTWFDRDELRRIVEFIKAGGLEKARHLEMGRIEEQRRQLRAERVAGAFDTRSGPYAYGRPADDWGAIPLVARLLQGLLD